MKETVTIKTEPDCAKAGNSGRQKTTAKKQNQPKRERRKKLAQEARSVSPGLSKAESKVVAKTIDKLTAREMSHPHSYMDMHGILKNLDTVEAFRQLDAAAQDMLKSFIITQVNPEVLRTRIPDGDSKKSAYVYSVKTFDVEVNMSTTNNGIPGQFAFIVQPYMGNVSDPKLYQIAYCDPSLLSNGAVTSADWLSVGSYLIADPTSGIDLRLDTNFYELLTPPPGSYKATQGAGVTNGKMFGNNVVKAASSANLDVFYDSTTTQGTFVFPPGQYYILVQVTGTATISAVSATGGANAATATLEAFFGNPAGTAYFCYFRVVATDLDNRFSVFATTTGTLTTATIIASTTIFDDAVIAVNGGAIDSMRPVAQTVIVTPTVTDYDKGGKIAGAFLPNCARNSRFFTNTPPGPQGSLRTHAAISNLQDGAASKDFAEGLYMWWTQLNPGDYIYYEPDRQNVTEYPTLVCAGIWEPSAVNPVTGLHNIARVIVRTVFEFLTEDQAFPVSPYVGSQAILDGVSQFYQNLPHVMGNPEHIGFFKWLLEKVTAVASGIGRVASAVETAAPLVAGLI